LFSPQIFSKSQNKETELKKREREKEKKEKVLKKGRERKELQKSLIIKGWISLERRNISTSNLFAWVDSLSLSILTLSLNCFETFFDSFGTIP
jgi:hypothetical protein